jgi:uncharacterized protein (TIGR02679 family)
MSKDGSSLTPKQVLAELRAYGLGPALDAALSRYRRDGLLGRSRPSLPTECWQALGRLTGKPQETLDLELLDATLQRSRYQMSLLQVLEVLHGGPVRPRQVEQALMASSLEEGFQELIGAVTERPWRELLSSNEAGAALLRRELRLGHTPLTELRQANAALRVLRKTQDVSPPLLPILAANVSGNAHALDQGTLAGQLLEDAVEALGLESPARDGLSSTVLAANLRGGWLTSLPSGTVIALPWREVMKLSFVHAPQQRVFVVENPAVCEGLLSALPDTPVICVSGQPSAAAVQLLNRLQPGTQLHLSCDHDLGGLRIARRLMRLPLDWHPWRMDPGSYDLARSRGNLPLPRLPDGDWGPLTPLAEAMIAYGQAAHQELLLPELIADVRRLIISADEE